MSAFEFMPQFVQIDDIRRSLSTDRLGYRWTFDMDLSMGNAPALTCGQDPSTPSSQTCVSSTIVEGNEIGGYFILGNTQLLRYDISASDMQAQLESLFNFGDIAVSRTGPTPLNGYTWLITWLTAPGSQPLIATSNSLTGSSARVIVSRVQRGNYLGGSYSLTYNGISSRPISALASPIELQLALQNMSSVGAVSVSVSNIVSSEGGHTYQITFLDQPGNLPLLIPETKSLTGVGATVNLFEVVPGSNANGTALKLFFNSQYYCSNSKVQDGICGSPVTSYEVKVGLSPGVASQLSASCPIILFKE